MPANAPSSTAPQKALVIVESPTKASTIRKYLGDGFEVEASVGHIRDLVTKRTELPERDKRRNEPWVTYGVNIDNGFEPLEEIYRVSAQKKRQIDTLRHRLDDADALYLATDDDREGEAISWHLLEELKPKVPVRRLVFREITKKAIQQALDATRDVDMDLVNAQRARRIVDRLYGWDVSQVLWRKIKPGLSAGRVQSVAQRMLVVRERERIAFLSTEYWDLLAHFEAGGQRFDASLLRLGERRVAASRDFEATTGIRRDESALLLDAAAAASLRDRLASGRAHVVAREVKPLTRRPQPPYTTSTLQQEANRKLRMSAQHAMRVAQALYEKGLITYMRTDSVRLSDEALAAAQATIRQHFGAELAAEGPRHYETRSAGAQEAHEAIRPAGDAFLHPRDLGPECSDQERRLYELIWRRAVASQMADAQLEQTTLDIAVGAGGKDDAVFRASGRAVRFAGFLAAWAALEQSSESDDESDGESGEEDVSEARLPLLAEGDAVGFAGVDPAVEAREHHTRPPARLTDASLVKSLEEKGIGRPSTYAAIIQGLLDRGYCFRRGSALVPTFMGMAVIQMLERWLPDLVDYDFTASMEAQLDAIARGEGDCGAYLRGFYREGFHGKSGHEVDGLVSLLAAARDEIDPAVASAIELGSYEGENVAVRIGRYGTFVKVGERTATVPEDQAPDEMTVERAMELIRDKERGDAPLGEMADGTPIFLRNGRYGWYLQAGKSGDGEPKPTMVSLSKGMSAENMTLDLALRQLALPRALGKHPGKKVEIEALVGRYGDYVKMSEETRSLPTGQFAIDITLDEAVALLDKPRARGGRELVREIGIRERDGATIGLWTGRWGLYVTDGKANANLRDEDPDSVDLERAIAMIDKSIEDKAGRLLGNDPESGAEIRVMRGPFGHYLTNGALNASLPRGTEPDEVDLTFALTRIAEWGKPVKAKKGARKPKAAAAKAEAKPAAKKAAAKKPAAKKPAAKKAAAKKPAAKK